MNASRVFLLSMASLLALALLAGCSGSGTCTFTATDNLTVYRMPTETSDVFGTIGNGDTFEAEARTADGWVGFDPGIAQAGNMGLARWRWVKDPLIFNPSCFDNVELVTLEQVQADIDASGGG